MNHPAEPNVTLRWDAGEAGCGQLVIGIKQRLSRLAAGEVLEVKTRDAGARIDIFVWCRMTGHRLLREAHPIYLVQRHDT